jgi:hypothetical protein
MNTEPAVDQKEPHGTVIARICYPLDSPQERIGKDGEPYTISHEPIGLLIFYRTGEFQFRLDVIPVSAWTKGIEWFIGNFIPSEKVPEAPYVDGDLIAATDKRGEPCTIGYVQGRQDELGRAQYYMKFYGLPVSGLKSACSKPDGKKSMYLRVRQNEK